jgi:hypothetical protein
MQVKLRCVVAPNLKFVVGRRYEVVEIMEMPGHAMVRKPDGRWPKPGEAYFGWHAYEYFEPSPSGIPAYSCGYQLVEEEFYGVIIPNSLHRTPHPRLFKRDRASERVSKIVDGANKPGLWWFAQEHVLPKCCWPKTLEGEFMAIGFNHEALGREVSYQAAGAAIQKVMRQLGIPPGEMPPVEDQWLECWKRSHRPAGMWKWPNVKMPVAGA